MGRSHAPAVVVHTERVSTASASPAVYLLFGRAALLLGSLLGGFSFLRSCRLSFPLTSSLLLLCLLLLLQFIQDVLRAYLFLT